MKTLRSTHKWGPPQEETLSLLSSRTRGPHGIIYSGPLHEKRGLLKRSHDTGESSFALCLYLCMTSWTWWKEKRSERRILKIIRSSTTLLPPVVVWKATGESSWNLSVAPSRHFSWWNHQVVIFSLIRQLFNILHTASYLSHEGMTFKEGTKKLRH